MKKTKTATQRSKRSSGMKAQGAGKRMAGKKAAGTKVKAQSRTKASATAGRGKTKAKSAAKRTGRKQTSAAPSRTNNMTKATARSTRGRTKGAAPMETMPMALGGVQQDAVLSRTEETTPRPYEARDTFRTGNRGAQARQNDVVAAQNRRPIRHSRAQVGARHH